MSSGGFSKARLGRMHDVMAGYVERGEVPGPDPQEEMVTILMTQRAWTSPSPPDVCRDFWTSAYQAIDD